MKLLLNTYCTADLDGCSYAFLDLDPELARVILRRRDLLRNAFNLDSSVTAMDFYDCSPVFIRALPEALESEEPRYDEPFGETTANVEAFEDVAERTDCDRMVIGSSGVYWSCYPKHLDHAVETCEIDYETIQKAIG